MRVDRQGKWVEMQQINITDPAFLAEKQFEAAINKDKVWIDLPGAHSTPHMWRGMMPTNLNRGSHVIEIRSIEPSGTTNVDHRIIRVETGDS